MTIPFENIFGSTPELKLLEYILPLENVNISEVLLKDAANINYDKLDRILHKFIKWGILTTHKEEIFPPTAWDTPNPVKFINTYYVINSKSPIFRELKNLNFAIIEVMTK